MYVELANAKQTESFIHPDQENQFVSFVATAASNFVTSSSEYLDATSTTAIVAVTEIVIVIITGPEAIISYSIRPQKAAERSRKYRQ